MTAVSTVRDSIEKGDFKKAFRVAKGFRLGISKDESNRLKLAYECLVHPEFYAQLGMDTTTVIAEGIQILYARFGYGEDGNM